MPALVVFMSLTTMAFQEDPMPVKIGTLQAVAPETWKVEKPANRLRSYQFRLPAGQEGVADAEINVRPQSSPKIEREFPRWKNEFTPPEGKTLEEISTTREFMVGQATVHLLDVTGTWKYREFPQSRQVEDRPDYRAIWAVVVEKEETTHIRLSGPKDVVAKYSPGFETWLKALR